MRNPYAITKEQKAILNGLVCQRITADPENEDLIYDFRARYSSSLEDTLKDSAWKEDKDARPAAYYVIKDDEGILLYFSLRCGVLYDPDYVKDVTENYNRSKELLDALRDFEHTPWADDYLETLRTSDGAIPPAEVRRIKSKFYSAQDERQALLGDKKRDSTRNMRVAKTLPAVELVHFCKNINAEERWKQLGLNHEMGETLFWWFVIPKIVQINELVGCEYVYLFAADKTSNRRLITYYETTLHFYESRKLVTLKPRYDFLCPMMCRRLYKLTRYRKSALGKLLPDEEKEDPQGLWDYRKQFLDSFNDIPSEDDC